MNSCGLSLTAIPHGSPLSLQVKLDGVSIFKQAVTERQVIDYVFDDTPESVHQLEIELFGKTAEHTKITETGEIIEDCVINIENITLDGVVIDTMFMLNSQYCHDFNGSQAPVTDVFYGTLGCNGTVKFEFTSPAYIWLLENM